MSITRLDGGFSWGSVHIRSGMSRWRIFIGFMKACKPPLRRPGVFCRPCVGIRGSNRTQGMPASFVGCFRPPCWPGFEKCPPRVKKKTITGMERIFLTLYGFLQLFLRHVQPLAASLPQISGSCCGVTDLRFLYFLSSGTPTLPRILAPARSHPPPDLRVYDVRGSASA